MYDDIFSLIQYRRFLILCLRFKIVSKLLTTETTIRGNVKYYNTKVDYRKPMTPGYIHVHVLVCTLLQLGTSTSDCTTINQFLNYIYQMYIYCITCIYTQQIAQCTFIRTCIRKWLTSFKFVHP